MESEGKVLGYNKKTITVVVLLIVVAGVMFYAGAQYEKKKLGSMGLLKSAAQTKQGGTKSKTTKSGTAPVDNSGTQNNTPAPSSTSGQATTPSGDSTAPSSTGAPSTSTGNGAY